MRRFCSVSTIMGNDKKCCCHVFFRKFSRTDTRRKNAPKRGELECDRAIVHASDATWHPMPSRAIIMLLLRDLKDNIA